MQTSHHHIRVNVAGARQMLTGARGQKIGSRTVFELDRNENIFGCRPHKAEKSRFGRKIECPAPLRQLVFYPRMVECYFCEKG